MLEHSSVLHRTARQHNQRRCNEHNEVCSTHVSIMSNETQDQDDDDGGHEYGVEPLGNTFLRGGITNCRPGGLGSLATFDVSTLVG